MGEYTYRTRRKLSEAWVEGMRKKGESLSCREKEMLPDSYHYGISQDVCQFMRQLLEEKKYKTLSALYKGEFKNLVDVCVKKEWQEEFYYALDEMNCYQMTRGWFRRSFRSKSYVPFVEDSIRLLHAYGRLEFYGENLGDILTGNVSPEIYDHARKEHFSYAGILAAQIDRGEEKTIQGVKDIFFGENNTEMLSRELILGIVMGKNKEMYEVLGKFLLAARLQEGARQVVCETMDGGRPEAFLHLFSLIEEKDLIRYSSVRRAVSTWIGIFNEKSVDRISKKLLSLMGQCLRDEAFAKEQLASNDAVAICCALWAKGFYDVEDGVENVLRLLRQGTKEQKMTASYFILSLEDGKQKRNVVKEVILLYSEDIELIACYLPGFMCSINSYFCKLIDNQNIYSIQNDKVRKPNTLAVEEFFENKEEAEKIYIILKGIMERIPKKGLLLSPCIFPWHEVSMSQSHIAVRLCLIAWVLQNDRFLDETAQMIPLIGQGEGSPDNRPSRGAVARVLLYRPASDIRKKVLFELLHNGEESTNESAHKLAEDMELSEEDYRIIEKNLKYKKGRAKTLALLGRQDKKNLLACIRRLLKEKSEEYRTGALDLALELKKQDEETFSQIFEEIQKFSASTGKEQILLKELLDFKKGAQDILKTPGFGLYDVKKDWVLPPIKLDKKEEPKFFVRKEEECIGILKKLDKLIDENRERAYKTFWEEDLLLGTKLEMSQSIFHRSQGEALDAYPFRELWEEFYEKEIKTSEFLVDVELYLLCFERRNSYEENANLYREIFGKGIIKNPPFSNLVIGLSYDSQVRTILHALFRQYVPPCFLACLGLWGISKLLLFLDSSKDLFSDKEKGGDKKADFYGKQALDLPIFRDMCQWLSYALEEDWERTFTIRFYLQQYSHVKREKEEESPYIYRSRRNYLNLSDYVQCYVRGIWDKDLFYKAVFTFLDIGSILEPITVVEQKGAVPFRKTGSSGLTDFFGDNKMKPVDGKYRFDTIGEESREMAFAHELYREVLPVVLKVELKRGEQPTPFSKYIKDIYVIYGIGYMIEILTALGKDPLKRGYSHFYFTPNTERKEVLSHLLKVSMPKQEETAEDLKKALKERDITKKRLVELAMYAHQWIPMLENYFKLPGFASACYYFMAHTSEYFDDEVISIIAKYTPLSKEELRDGAFDIHWFFEAYERLGEKHFKLLYDAAKYSSVGTAHTRARKYADAALGKVDKEELKAEINEKRNKDLLMSIALLPLPASKEEREEELLDRYQFIQKYKKESRQFGAVRRASEGRAVEIALCNLSVNAGFTDVMRLILRMEGRLTKQSKEYFQWQTIDDIELMVSVDEHGKSTLKCRKEGKLLKSLPTKYKKNKRVMKFQEVTKKLKEQYSRTKQMMEEAMEDHIPFEAWELLEMRKSPVARPMIETLVVKTSEEKNEKIGFLTKEGIMDISGNLLFLSPRENIFIVHPLHLYKIGKWHEYQKLLFERQIKQPFKQVFRELYVKLDEELEKGESMMFSGYQIQPKKTVSTLRSRRWVADYNSGLQKVYYKENIVACIYAMADWFSPSDIEAPVLEYVAFLDRKTGKSLKIKDIPDRIYSEVMRDVDLAVSVAYGGGVDPETSHSTIEMRRVIVECNLSLFQTKNVRLKGNHAIIDGKRGQYTVHLGSGVVHQMGNAMIFVVPVHSQHRGRVFLPFVDEDPKTAEIMSKILLFAEDDKIKDPKILSQI